MHEIERKFLVTMSMAEIVGVNTYEKDGTIFALSSSRVEQCYLSDTGEWTIRVRRSTALPTLWKGQQITAPGPTICTKTMKRKVTDRKCVELEVEIDEDHFEKVRALCGPMLEKTRTRIRVGDHIWEIDEFSQFSGLVVAEIELKDEDESFEIPEWLGKEVTEKKKYRNRQMAITLEELTR